jgi:hypothetical protein
LADLAFTTAANRACDLFVISRVPVIGHNAIDIGFKGMSAFSAQGIHIVTGGIFIGQRASK